jgi:hypothetical protein
MKAREFEEAASEEAATRKKEQRFLAWKFNILRKE